MPTRNITTDTTATEILDLIESERQQLQAFGVRTLGLFGSYRRGAAHSASDIDVLVTFERPSFRDYMETKAFLERLFHRPVDLVLEENLKPRLRSQIMAEVAYAEGLSPVSG